MTRQAPNFAIVNHFLQPPLQPTILHSPSHPLPPSTKPVNPPRRLSATAGSFNPSNPSVPTSPQTRIAPRPPPPPSPKPHPTIHQTIHGTITHLSSLRSVAFTLRTRYRLVTALESVARRWGLEDRRAEDGIAEDGMDWEMEMGEMETLGGMEEGVVEMEMAVSVDDVEAGIVLENEDVDGDGKEMRWRDGQTMSVQMTKMGVELPMPMREEGEGGDGERWSVQLPIREKAGGIGGERWNGKEQESLI